MRMFLSVVVGAILGFFAPILLCVIAAVLLFPAGSAADPATGHTGADAILALAPLLALVGLFAGVWIGVAYSNRRTRRRGLLQ